MRHGRGTALAILCLWISLFPGAHDAAAQDACSSLTRIACNDYLMGSTVGQPNLLGGPAGDVLYVLETTDELFYGFSLVAGMALAPGLTLYEGCALEPGAQVLATGTTPYNTSSELTALLPANSTFTLLVEGATADGAFDLSVWCLACNPGPCEGITESEPNPGPGGGAGSFDAITCDVPTCGSLDAVGNVADEDWFVLELTEDAAIWCSLVPGGFDPTLEFHQGLGGDLLQLSDFSGMCYSEGVETACLPAGTYSFRVTENAGQPLTGAAYQLFLGCNPCTWVDPLSNCQAFERSGELDQFPLSEEDNDLGTPLRAEHFGHGGWITAIDVVGIQANSSNLPCSDPQFRVVFYGDGSEPGAELASWLVTGTATPTGETFFFGIPIVQWHLPLPAPFLLESGYVEIRGAGDADCTFGWGRSPGADGFHWTEEGGWGTALEDLNFCLTLTTPSNCPAPTNLQVSLQGQDALLSWTAVPEATSYQVLSSATGYGPWSPLGTSPTNSFLDTGALPAGLRCYQVRSVCP